jgi:beta-N-acetylhexosaminidase
VAVPQLTGDPIQPATLSHAILTNLLRSDLGFDGLIAADSLGMNALDVAYGITNTVALAVDAGVDLLLFGADPGHTPVEQDWAFDHLLARMETGQLTEARLDESVRRILQTKAKYGLLRPDPTLTEAPSAEALAQAIRTPDHLALTARVSEEALSIAKNEADLLPLCPDQSVALIYHAFEPDLPPVLGKYAPQLLPILMTGDPTPEERAQLLAATETADVVIVATVYADRRPGQAALVQELQGRNVVVLALTNPYDILAFPNQPTYLTTYSDNLPLLEAAAKLIYGQVDTTGTPARCN